MQRTSKKWRNAVLFGLPTLIWGSTWLVITATQLDVTTPEISVFYRFLVASIVSFGVCLAAKKNLKFSLADHFLLLPQGLFMFCLNYVLTYHAEKYVTSGLVALVFTFLLYFNMAGQKLIFRVAPDRQIIFAAVLGAFGLLTIFWKEAATDLVDRSTFIKGFALALVATFSASVGNQFASVYKKRNIPVLQGATWAMFYGMLWTGLIALMSGQSFTVKWTLPYTLGLLYLAIPGTILAFNFYLRLVNEMGPTRASYASVVIPVIALIFSSFFENFSWTPQLLFGMVCIGFGQWIVLKSSDKGDPSPNAKK